jgi:hypothetical protein
VPTAVACAPAIAVHPALAIQVNFLSIQTYSLIQVLAAAAEKQDKTECKPEEGEQYQPLHSANGEKTELKVMGKSKRFAGKAIT